jgi:hypothetical protein
MEGQSFPGYYSVVEGQQMLGRWEQVNVEL